MRITEIITEAANPAQHHKEGTKKKGDTRVNNCVKVSEGVEDIMDALINKIIVNETIQNNRK